MEELITALAQEITERGPISEKYYERYDVKRGLRNQDGSGVLVGLTEIGNVHGFVVVDKDVTPDEGSLSYRGYNVEDLVKGFQTEKRFGFEEVIYLLIFGKLPTPVRLQQFCDLMKASMDLPPRFNEDMIMSAPSNNIMNKLARSVLALYSYDPKADDLDTENVLRQCIELCARFPVLIAYAYQALQHYFRKKTLHIRLPNKEFSLAENFLHLTRLNETFTRLEADILDLALVLHAEHGGGNNSSFTVHVVSSTHTDTYSAIAAAIGSLKGPKHGGANEKVMDMMRNIKENVKDWADKDEVGAYIEKIVCKEAHDRSGLVYGIGHAVYTLSDPRSIIFKSKVKELARARGSEREKEMNLYLAVEELAPGIVRRLKGSGRPVSANVDFFSGFVYDMLGIPPEIYTPIFAMSRIAGWSAHRIEELISGRKIIRPAYKSLAEKKSYIPLDQRK